MRNIQFGARPSEQASVSRNFRQAWRVVHACAVALVIAGCGSGASDNGEPLSATDAGVLAADSKEVVEGDLRSPSKPASRAPVPAKQGAEGSPASVTEAQWLESAIRDMRAADGSMAIGEDTAQLSPAGAGVAGGDRATLRFQRMDPSTALTAFAERGAGEFPLTAEQWPGSLPDQGAQLRTWLRVLAPESPGAGHQPGYAGNSRVRVWGLEVWIRSAVGSWTRLTPADTPIAPDRALDGSQVETADGSLFDVRAEPDGSLSLRPEAARVVVSSGQSSPTQDTIETPPDVAHVLVLFNSQLVLHDPQGFDDREHARFLVGAGAAWLPPVADGAGFPVVAHGESRLTYATTQPRLHFLRSLSESQLREDPPLK